MLQIKYVRICGLVKMLTFEQLNDPAGIEIIFDTPDVNFWKNLKFKFSLLDNETRVLGIQLPLLPQSSNCFMMLTKFQKANFK